MAMKIVNQRGKIVTADDFRERLNQIVARALELSELSSVSPDDDTDAFVFEKGTLRTPVAQLLRQEAAKSIQSLGLDPSSKRGQAAAGVSMFASTLAAGMQKYIEKTGKNIPPEVIRALEAKLAVEMLEKAALPQSPSPPQNTPTDEST